MQRNQVMSIQNRWWVCTTSTRSGYDSWLLPGQACLDQFHQNSPMLQSGRVRQRRKHDRYGPPVVHEWNLANITVAVTKHAHLHRCFGAPVVQFVNESALDSEEQIMSTAEGSIVNDRRTSESANSADKLRSWSPCIHSGVVAG